MKVSKSIIIFSAFLLMAACKQKGTPSISNDPPESSDTTDAGTIPADQLISPGGSIGQIKLNSSLADAIKLLGKPDGGDAAMGSSLATWYANHDNTGYRTSIYAHRNMGGQDENTPYIKKILVTSPWFKTADYISTGNDIKDIGKYYTLKEGNSYNLKGEQIKTYADTAKGIAFEIDGKGKCVSVSVYQPNSGPGTYLDMH